MLRTWALVILVAAGSGCARITTSPDDAVPPAVQAQAKPLPPARVALGFREERPRRGEEIELDLILTTTVALSRVHAALRLPSQMRLIGSGSVWEGPLTPEAPRTLTFRVRIESQDRFDLGASVEILEGPYAHQIAGAVVYVDATRPRIRWERHPLED